MCCFLNLEPFPKVKPGQTTSSLFSALTPRSVCDIITNTAKAVFGLRPSYGCDPVDPPGLIDTVGAPSLRRTTTDRPSFCDKFSKDRANRRAALGIPEPFRPPADGELLKVRNGSGLLPKAFPTNSSAPNLLTDSLVQPGRYIRLDLFVIW